MILSIRYLNPTTGAETSKGISGVTNTRVDTHPATGRLEVLVDYVSSEENRREIWTDVTWYRITE